MAKHKNKGRTYKIMCKNPHNGYEYQHEKCKSLEEAERRCEILNKTSPSGCVYRVTQLS